jgi:Domain of unknown function (DUF4349)
MGGIRRLAFTAVALGLAAAACGSGGGVGGGGGGAAPPRGSMTAAPAPRVAGEAKVAGGIPELGLRIVKRGFLSIEVPSGSFQRAMDRASITAGRYGGFVETSSTRGVKVRSGTLVIRVPAESFEQAVHDLRTLGQVKSQTVSGRDVTSRFVDLQARRRNLRTQEAVLRRLLAKAPTVNATLNVQRVLSDVQLGIEELTGQLNALGNQVDLSTIRVGISEPGATPLTEGVEKPKLQTAFDTAVAAFLGVIYGLIVGIGVLIPVSILAGLGVLVYRLIRDRRRAPAL